MIRRSSSLVNNSIRFNNLPNFIRKNRCFVFGMCSLNIKEISCFGCFGQMFFRQSFSIEQFNFLKISGNDWMTHESKSISNLKTKIFGKINRLIYSFHPNKQVNLFFHPKGDRTELVFGNYGFWLKHVCN